MTMLALALALSACAATPPPSVQPGANGPPPGWHEFKLPGKRSTRYTLAPGEGAEVIRAEADASASMLRRIVHVDASELGQLEFSWRVAQLIAGADLTDRDASDSPVRLVLAFGGDAARLPERTRVMFDLAQALTGEPPPYATLIYAWDNRAERETVIHSRRTDRIRKIVVESGAQNVGSWRHYQRDITADYRRAFGEAPGPLIGIGLMTDADNTAARASALYGPVRLVAADGRRL